ncbi:MAG: ABC transporter ATP-binding protein, partial [Clostridiales bacterium]|nr:ABC transporter ATP-binding protein [Clostridiales bacterium]
MKNILQKRQYKSRDLLLLMCRVSPLFSAIAVIYRLIGAAIPTLTIIATAGFINAALSVVAGTRELSAIVLPISGLMGVTLFQALIGSVIMGYINCRRSIYFRRVLRPMIIARVAALEYRHIENQDTADLISRVAPNFDTQIAECFDSVISLAGQVISALGVVITVMAGAWWAGLIIGASAVPLMIIAKKAGERSYEAGRETSKLHRRTAYLSGVLKSREAVEERTVYGYTDAMNDVYMEQFHKARKIQQWVNLKNFIKMKAGGVFGSIIAIGTILTMVPSVLNKSIDYGMFIALMGGIINLVRSMSWGVNNLIQNIAAKREYLRDLTKFMELEAAEDFEALPEPG